MEAKLQEIKELVETSLTEDVIKASKGNKAAAKRVRLSCQKLKTLAQDLRLATKTADED